MPDRKILGLVAEGGMTPNGANALAQVMNRRRMSQRDVSNYVQALEASRPKPPVFQNFVAYPLGIGITFRGKKFASGADLDSEIQTSTRWIIFFWVPIVPISTWRFVDLGGTRGFFSSSRDYRIVQKVPLDWVQIMKTWVASTIAIFAVVGIFSIIQ
jgi:hypothetical protein